MEQVIKSKEAILKSVYEKHRNLINPDGNWADWETCDKDGTTQLVYEAMEQYASQFEGKQGWVKASVRLPKVDGVYFIRCYHNGKICLRKTAVLDDSHFLEVIYQDGYDYDDFEWLDESADNPTVDSIRVKEAKERHKLQEENERLREALKPFAKVYSALTEIKINQGGVLYAFNKSTITIENLRAAHDLIEELQNKQL